MILNGPWVMTNPLPCRYCPSDKSHPMTGRSIPSISSAGKTWTTVHHNNTVPILKAVMFIPICSRPPKGMIFRPNSIYSLFLFQRNYLQILYVYTTVLSVCIPALERIVMLCKQRPVIYLLFSRLSFSKTPVEIRHPRSYDSIKITVLLMPFVYSLSRAQNHYSAETGKASNIPLCQS